MASASTLFSKIPGGQYSAKQNGDGTWDVRDVPVFSVVEKGTKKAPRDITSEDLHGAVKAHQAKYSDDRFLARANVLHNFGVHRPTPAGFFLPHSVRPFRMDGKIRPTIFADLLAVPDEVFRQMDRNDLPYCSVEVRSYTPLTFGALALLDTEPPFFEFPLITIGEKAADVSAVRTDDQAIAVASFRFQEDSMEDPKKDHAIPEVNMQDDPVEEKEEKDDGQYEEGDAGGAVKAIESMLKQLQPILDLKDKILALVSGGDEAPVEEEEIATDGPVDQPVSAMSADVAKLEGRIAGLEQYRTETETSQRVEEMFTSAMTKLDADHFSVPDKVKVRMRELAGHGEAVFSAFVDSYRETAIQDPDPQFAGLPTGEESWPSEVMTYAQQSPENFTAAKEAYRLWAEFPDDRHRSPLEMYLKREVG